MEFRFTNESLAAINEGLTPQKGDRILCVGGSGDQGFSLLLFGAEIFFVDNASKQCRHIQKRIDALRRNAFAEFWEGKRMDKKRRLATSRFFELNDPDYWEHLRENISWISVWQGDVFSLLERQDVGCDKIYLSNVIGRKHHSFIDTLGSLLEKQPSGTLIYCTNTDLGLEELGHWRNPLFEFDVERSKRARQAEQKENPYFSWNPVVAIRR